MYTRPKLSRGRAKEPLQTTITARMMPQTKDTTAHQRPQYRAGRNPYMNTFAGSQTLFDASTSATQNWSTDDTVATIDSSDCPRSKPSAATKPTFRTGPPTTRSNNNFAGTLKFSTKLKKTSDNGATTNAATAPKCSGFS